MPSAPIACAAVRIPWLCASSTPARISSSVNWAMAGTEPLVSTPPVAMNLMQSAPSLRCSRTALRTSHGPSASRPIHQPWPPVMQTTRPAATIVGPASLPALMASRRSMARRSVPPRSRIVVTPAASALRAFSAQM